MKNDIMNPDEKEYLYITVRCRSGKGGDRTFKYGKDGKENGPPWTPPNTWENLGLARQNQLEEEIEIDACEKHCDTPLCPGGSRILKRYQDAVKRFLERRNK